MNKMKKLLVIYKTIELEAMMLIGLGLGFVVGYVFAIVALLEPIG